MKIDASIPAVWPDCASPALPSALALSRNCRSEPAPASFAFTIVSKLKPKSMPAMSAVASVTWAIDCGVALPVVSAASAGS